MDLNKPLIDAVLLGDQHAIRHILSIGGNINSSDERGLTPLHWSAASDAGEELVPVLLSLGSKLDTRDKLGHTPLHLHSAKGRLFGVSCLLNQGCDSNARVHKTLQTPLHLACNNDHPEVSRVLLAYGAKMSVRDADGAKPNEIWTKDLGSRNLSSGDGSGTEGSGKYD